MPKKRLDSRPVNLQLWTLRFPVTAISSILHRLSGFGLFLFIPLMLWGLQYSLSSSSNFSALSQLFSSFSMKAVLWLVVSALLYHIIAGIRHLFMDIHIGDSKQGGTIGAYIVLSLSILLSLVFGVYLW